MIADAAVAISTAADNHLDLARRRPLQNNRPQNVMNQVGDSK